jgi:hypothetical protein
MKLSAQEINAQFLMLPEPEQQKVIDFVLARQIKRLKKPSKPLNQTIPQTEDEKELSPLYKAFEQAGFIGCMETDEQLSTTYKDKIDFASKYNIETAE